MRKWLDMGKSMSKATINYIIKNMKRFKVCGLCHMINNGNNPICCADDCEHRVFIPCTIELVDEFVSDCHIHSRTKPLSIGFNNLVYAGGGKIDRE